MASWLDRPESVWDKGSKLFEAGTFFIPGQSSWANAGNELRASRVQSLKDSLGANLPAAMADPIRLKKEMWATGKYRSLDEVNTTVEDLYSNNPFRNMVASAAGSAKTAEQAITPPPEQAAKEAVANETKATAEAEAAKAKQVDQVTRAIANQTAGGGGGKPVDASLFNMPTVPQASMTQAEPPKKDDTDYSKAMLRAGIAMMSSKGDIWDALAAGFGGYASSLDQQEADKAKAAKEAYERQLEEQKLAIEQYKANIYGAQTMASINQMNRKGSGGLSVGDQIDLMKLQQNKAEYAQKVRETMVELKQKASEARAMGDTATADSMQKDIYDMGVAAGIIQQSGSANTGAAALGGFIQKK